MTSDPRPATTELAICIPTYNRAEILRATLVHLAENHDLFEEVVICDNASPDHTQAVVEEMRPHFRRLVYIRHPVNIGGNRNCNAVLSQTRCPYQYLLSDDDRLLPSGMRAGLRYLYDHDDAVAVYGSYEAIDDAGVVSLDPQVSEPVCYKSADRFLMAQRHLVLWHPILRTDAFQRHCFYDDETWGYWRLIDQLLTVGSVWVVPDYFYCHVPTPGRRETAATEAWFQDFHRSDWELYLSRLAVAPEHGPLIAQLVTARLDSVLGNAQTWAQKLGLPLIERNFILRRRAYGNRLPETEQEWERRALMAGALERAVEQLTATGSSRVFIQSGAMTLPTLISSFEAALPSVAFYPAAREELVHHAAEPGDGLIAEDWSVFADRRSAGLVDEGICRLSWADILATLRLTDDKGVRMLRGPDGTTHVLRL